MANEFSKLNFVGAPVSLVDIKGQLTSHTITAPTSRTYIDADGVLQTLDGDDASTQEIVDDETGATTITAVFTAGSATLTDDAGIITAQVDTAFLVKLEDDGGLFAYGFIGDATAGGAKIYAEPHLTTNHGRLRKQDLTRVRKRDST